ncbi:hypothetical protein QBC44DRAFT_139501 [Cladorrhinum sp. PSN332]|nr:hypothetical protein QBC44DRAFT_139501 [Cladorrhinum sp. PSN332]
MAANASQDASMPDAEAQGAQDRIDELLDRLKVAHRTGAGKDGLGARHRTFDYALSDMREGELHNPWHFHVLPSINVHSAAFNPDKFYFENFDEAAAYIQDPYLGAHLGYILTVILEQTPAGVGVKALMGDRDDGVAQLHSCVTLVDWFMMNTDIETHDDVKTIPRQILAKYFNGEEKVHEQTALVCAAWGNGE